MRSGDFYFAGSMLANLAVAEGLFAVVFVTVMISTWPNVPWDMLTWALPAGVALTPILMLPFAKVAWLTFDVMFRPIVAGVRPGQLSAAGLPAAQYGWSIPACVTAHHRRQPPSAVPEPPHAGRETMLTVLAFGMVLTFMTLIMTKRLAPLTALILVPIAFGLLEQVGKELDFFFFFRRLPPFKGWLW